MCNSTVCRRWRYWINCNCRRAPDSLPLRFVLPPLSISADTPQLPLSGSMSTLHPRTYYSLLQVPTGATSALACCAARLDLVPFLTIHNVPTYLSLHRSSTSAASPFCVRSNFISVSSTNIWQPYSFSFSVIHSCLLHAPCSGSTADSA
jgi:hypothetical protein